MNALVVALLASAVVLVSARNVNRPGLSGRLLTPDEQTLKTLLSTPGGSTIGGADSKVPVAVLEYNLNRDYDERINPSNPTSDWKWMSVRNGEYVADSGTILRDGISGVELVSVPFRKWLPQEAGRLALLTNHEAVLENKIKFVVEPDYKLTVRAVFSAQFKNIEDNLFDLNSIVNVTDDPSIIHAGIHLASTGMHGLCFSIVASRKGIWAIYERNRVGLVEHPERDDKIFTVFHRLADRKSEEEEIDAAITYDRRENAVLFKLNNVVVYRLKHLGKLPEKEVGTLAHTPERTDLVEVDPKQFVVSFGLGSILDAQDPNNQAHSTRAVRLSTEDVYDPKARFYNDVSNKTFDLYGQGAILKMHDITIRLQPSAGDREGNNKDSDKLKVRHNINDVNEDTDDGHLIVPQPTEDIVEVRDIVNNRRGRSEGKQDDDSDESRKVSVQDDEEDKVRSKIQDDDTDDSIRRQARRTPSVRGGGLVTENQ